MRYFLTLGYRGTRYAGWQRQPNAVTVQETLETALSTILRQPIEVTGCGRTDAGVHARYYVAHVDVPDDLPAKFLYSLNGILPHDIAVYAARPVHTDAHARHRQQRAEAVAEERRQRGLDVLPPEHVRPPAHRPEGAAGPPPARRPLPGRRGCG